MSTDYDCWKENEEPVTWEMVLGTMNRNAENVRSLIVKALPHITDIRCCAGGH